MKKTPKKKSSSKVTVKHKVVELPSDNKEMEDYVLANRLEINEKIIDSIEYAIKNKLAGVEVFCFKGSNFVVVLHRKDFKESLENIHDFSMNKEKFEMCIRVKKLIDLVNKFGFVYNCKKKPK
jgi:hypothetical protein